MAAFGLVLLAAGASERLGSPKQNLLFQNQTLLQHAVRAARQSGCAPIIVVLGAQAALFRAQLNPSGIILTDNPAWKEGMGASIRYGVAALSKAAPAVSGVILMLCDQPFVTGELLQKLITTKESGEKQIVACSYQNTLGTPVLFDKQYFPELLALQGTHGAKKLLYQYPETVAAVPFELGSFDIDTAADYTAFQHYLTSGAANPENTKRDTSI